MKAKARNYILRSFERYVLPNDIYTLVLSQPESLYKVFKDWALIMTNVIIFGDDDDRRMNETVKIYILQLRQKGHISMAIV